MIQDATLDRTARGPAENCIGLVVEKTLEQLKTWDLGSWFNETKNPDDADHVEERLVALLDEYNLLRGAAERWQVLVQSFSPDSLLRLQALEPELPLIALFFGSETSQTIQARLATVARYAVGIEPSKNDVDAALVAAAHQRCLDIHPYTVNKSDEMRTPIGLGVDGMSTNFPARLDEVSGRGAVGGEHAAKHAAGAHADCLARG